MKISMIICLNKRREQSPVAGRRSMRACRMLGKREGAGIVVGNFGPGSDQTGPLLGAEASGPVHVLMHSKNKLTKKHE